MTSLREESVVPALLVGARHIMNALVVAFVEMAMSAAQTLEQISQHIALGTPAHGRPATTCCAGSRRYRS